MEEIVNSNGKEKITDLLDRRHKERQMKKESDLVEKKKGEESTEALEYFEALFDDKSKLIQNTIDGLEEIDDKPKAFADLQSAIQDLQKYLSASTFFVNDYRVKKCQNTINDLNQKVESLKSVMVPKKKFGFSNKKEKKVKVEMNIGDNVDNCDKKLENDTKTEQIKWTIKDRKNELILMKGEDVDEETITASNLTDCVLRIEGHPGSIQISNMKNSLVFCGPVSRSIFLDNCEDCKIVVACQQLRCHTSKRCELYLHVTSRAIIEDCSEIMVAKYNFAYENLDEDYNKSGLDPEANNWSIVDDFNWLSLDKPSPNWAILEDGKLTTDWEDYTNQFKLEHAINA